MKLGVFGGTYIPIDRFFPHASPQKLAYYSFKFKALDSPFLEISRDFCVPKMPALFPGMSTPPNCEADVTKLVLIIIGVYTVKKATIENARSLRSSRCVQGICPRSRICDSGSRYRKRVRRCR